GEQVGTPMREPPEDRVEKTPALRVGVPRRRAGELDERAWDAEVGGARSVADHLGLEETALSGRFAPHDLLRRDPVREELPRRCAPAVERRLNDDVAHGRMLSPGEGIE